MKRILAALLLFPAFASAQTVMTGFASRHSQPGYCESNHGIGYRHDTGDWAGWGIGAYRNSMCQTSVYVAREWQAHIAGPLRAGIIVGAATGYAYPLVPVVLPELVAHSGKAEVALLIQPFEMKESPRFVAVQFRWRIK
jgi:hypothetical protein